MNRIGKLKLRRWGPVLALRGHYLVHNGPTAVVLVLEDGEELLANLSVNMYRPDCSEDSRDLPAGCFYVDTWNNEEFIDELRECGLFIERPDLPKAKSGFVTAPAWQIKPKPQTNPKGRE